MTRTPQTINTGPESLRGVTLSEGTLRIQDLINEALGFLNDIDAPEYVGYILSNIPPSYAQEDDESDWWIDEGPDVWAGLIDTLQDYGPEDCYFGSHEGDGACFGWWPIPQEPYEGQDHSAGASRYAG